MIDLSLFLSPCGKESSSCKRDSLRELQDSGAAALVAAFLPKQWKSKVNIYQWFCKQLGSGSDVCLCLFVCLCLCRVFVCACVFYYSQGWRGGGWQPSAGLSGHRKWDSLQSGVAPLSQALTRPTCRILEMCKTGKRVTFLTLTQCFVRRCTRSRGQVALPLISPAKDNIGYVGCYAIVLWSNSTLVKWRLEQGEKSSIKCHSLLREN